MDDARSAATVRPASDREPAPSRRRAPEAASPRAPTSCSSAARRSSRGGITRRPPIVLARAARLEPGRGSILEPLGRAYFMTGQLERARETFEALLAVDPSSHYGHYALGRTLIRLAARPRGGRTSASPSRWRPESRLYRGGLRRLGGE